MDRVEKLEGMLLMAIKRIEILERQAAAGLSALALDVDEAAAQRMAQEIGFTPAVLTVPAKREERMALARQLRSSGWSLARIARVLRTGERNIARWTAKEGTQ